MPIHRARTGLWLVVPALLAACGKDPAPPAAAGAPAAASAPAPPPAPKRPPPDLSDPKHATPAGEVAGPAVRRRIGPEGGRLGSADGRLSVEVPAGALPAPTELSITPIANTAHGGVGAGYRIEAGGARFAQPVSLVFKADDASLEGTAFEALAIARRMKDGRWGAFEDGDDAFARDPASRTVTVRTASFSDWSLVSGWQIRPARARVKVGGTVRFEVKECVTQTGTFTVDGETYTVPKRIAACDEPELAPIGPRASGWAVDGTPGGSPQKGTVDGWSNATYTAPANVPSPDTVTVSAQILVGRESARQKVLSTATVQIYDGWVGQVTFESREGSRVVKSVADVVWNAKPGSKTEFVPSGTLTVTGRQRDCTLQEQARITEADGELELKLGPDGQPTAYRGFGMKSMPLRFVCPKASGTQTMPVAWFGTTEAFQLLRNGALQGSLSAPDGPGTWTWSFTR